MSTNDRLSDRAKAHAYDRFMGEFERKIAERPLPNEVFAFHGTAILLDHYAKAFDAAQSEPAGVSEVEWRPICPMCQAAIESQEDESDTLSDRALPAPAGVSDADARDAARYRWMRWNISGDTPIVCWFPDTESDLKGLTTLEGEEFDKAIDTAMAALAPTAGDP